MDNKKLIVVLLIIAIVFSGISVILNVGSGGFISLCQGGLRGNGGFNGTPVSGGQVGVTILPSG